MAKKKKKSDSRKKGYDSSFEMRLAEGPLKGVPYHSKHVTYEVPARKARYEPDFKYKDYLVEAKGRFRTSAEAKKYEHIISAGHKLVFIFQRPGVKMPGAQKRKDGTYRTMEEWADSLDVIYFFEYNAHELLAL